MQHTAPAQQAKETDTDTLRSETYIPQVLPRLLGSFDMIAFTFLALFWLSNVTGVVTGGAASFTYWIIGILFFFLPCTLVCAQLSRVYNHEGSIYNWTTRAFGPFWGFFVGLCTWVPGVVSVVSAVDVIVSCLQTMHPNWLTQPWQQGIVIIGIIFVIGILSSQPVRTVHYIFNSVFLTTMLLVVFLAFAAIVWLLTGHHSATNFGAISSWLPQGGGPQTNNFVLLGTVTLALLGTTGPLTMADEVKKGTSVTRYLLWGSALVVIAYLVSNGALLVIQGPDAALNAPNSVILIITTATTVLGPVVGKITSLFLMLFFLTVAVIYNCAYARLLLVSSIDKQLPLRLTRLNRFRVPTTSIWVGTLFAMFLVFMIFFVVPLFTFLGNPQVLNSDAYLVTAAGLLLVWAVSFLFPFLDFWVLHTRFPQRFKGKLLLPLPLLLACCILGPVICLLTIADTVAYSFAPALIPNGQWSLFILGFTTVILIICIIVSMIASAQATFEHFES